jgi:LPXTG-site transpeptidase (sortase) family protein
MAPNTPPLGSFRHPRAARRRSGAASWFESFLWVIGCAALGYCAFLWGRAEYDQAQGSRMVDQGRFDVKGRPAAGSLVGRIEIPRLKLSAVIFEGTDDRTLDRGVGHLAGSAAPGRRGNLVLAGHRDTFFASLKNIREGDEIDVTGPDGAFRYVAGSTEIVAPEATEVLRSAGGATLTLITCYPFRYVGNAPDRFIVHGRKLGDKEEVSHENAFVSGSQSGSARRGL